MKRSSILTNPFFVVIVTLQILFQHQLLPIFLPYYQSANALSNIAVPVRSNNNNNNSNNPLSTYCVNVQCTVKPHRRMEFLQLLQSNQQRTLQNEPEALQYVMGIDQDDENTFHIYEQFTNSDAFQYHRTTPHSKEWQQFTTTEPFVNAVTMNSYFGNTSFDIHKAEAPTASTTTDNNNNNNNNKAALFCLHVQLCIQPSHRDEFLHVIANNARGCYQEETLCAQYIWGEDMHCPNVFHFHEEYIGNNNNADGQQGFDAHTRSPHFAIWKKFEAKNPFAQPPIISFYRTLDNQTTVGIPL